VSSTMKEKINTIVLDDVLHSIFRVDPDGLIVGAMSTVVGTAGMYALPLNLEQRLRLAQSCWDYSFPPASLDAEVILTKPGGFLSALPENWRLSLQATHPSEQENGAADDYESLLLLENEGDKKRTAPGREEDQNLNQDNGVIMVRDMTWDDAEGEGDTDSTSSTTAANTTTDYSGSSIITPSRQSPSSLGRSSSTIVRMASQRNSRSASIMTNSRNNNYHADNDPFVVMTAVMQEILAEKLKFVLSRIDRRLVNSAGSTAIAALLLHLKFSRSARQTMSRFIHGSIALSLASTAAGCGIMSLAVSMHPFVDQHVSATVNRNVEGNSDNLTTSNGGDGSPDTSRGRNILASLLTVGVSGYGKALLAALHQIANIDRYKKTRKVLLLIFLFYFHQRRQRIALSGTQRSRHFRTR